jgi:hypothetical protein
MKNQFLLLLFAVLALQAKAQVGIGTVYAQFHAGCKRGCMRPIYQVVSPAVLALTDSDYTVVFLRHVRRERYAAGCDALAPAESIASRISARLRRRPY